MSYTAMDIAKYIINKCVADDWAVSNLQLQKILYFSFGEYLTKKNQCLFQEPFLAWKYGPVVENVYNNYRCYGASKIYDAYEIRLPDDVKEIIDPVIEQRRKQSIGGLLNDAHTPKGAWDKVYDGWKESVIPLEDIKEEFGVRE